MEAPRLIRRTSLAPALDTAAAAGRCEDVWQVLTAAHAGDLDSLRGALERDPTLVSAGYWYMPPLHFAVREGHLEAVRLLVAAGADLSHRNALYGNDTLLQMAEDRGHRRIAGFLPEGSAPAPFLDGRPARLCTRRLPRGDSASLARLLAADSRLVDLGDHLGRRPLHYAVAAGRGDLVDLLLNAGAEIDAPGFGGDDRLRRWRVPPGGAGAVARPLLGQARRPGSGTRPAGARRRPLPRDSSRSGRRGRTWRSCSAPTLRRPICPRHAASGRCPLPRNAATRR